MRGLSVIELCVTLAILVALARAALPNLAFLQKARLPSIALTFQAHLNLARSEAIKRGHRTALCKSADGQTCTAAGPWSQGWLVFEDADNNAQRDSGESILQVGTRLPQDIVLTGNLTVDRYISFTPEGSPALLSGAFQAGTVSICQRSAAPTQGHALVMSSTGRTRIRSATVSACA
jgi:type IV fimbrial biogenesis protein FimT